MQIKKFGNYLQDLGRDWIRQPGLAQSLFALAPCR